MKLPQPPKNVQVVYRLGTYTVEFADGRELKLSEQEARSLYENLDALVGEDIRAK